MLHHKFIDYSLCHIPEDLSIEHY